MIARGPSRSSALMAALALAAVASGALATGMQGSDRASRMALPGSADASDASAAAFADDAKLRAQDIAFYRDRVLADTMSAADLAQLAALYLQRARESGDIGDYGRAEAAARHGDIAAVVSRGGRPDLAGDELPRVSAATLLIVGGFDVPVIEMNRAAYRQLAQAVHKDLVIVPGASHLFEEPGKLDEVARLAGDWFVRFLDTAETLRT